MATIIDQLKVVLGFETKGMESVKAQVRSFGEGTAKELMSVKGIIAGMFTVGFGKELYGKLKESALEIKAISRLTGQSTDDVQRYQKAFSKVNLEVEDANRAFDILLEKRKEALEEGGKSARIFSAMGITEAELRNLESGAEIFERITRVANDPKNMAQREMFLDLFGTRRGGKLLAASQQLANQKEFPMFAEWDIDKFVEASKKMKEATHEFNVAAMPLAASLAGFSAKAMKWINKLSGDESQPAIDKEAIYQRAVGMSGNLSGRAIGNYSPEDQETLQNIIKETSFDWFGLSKRSTSPKQLQLFSDMLDQLETKGKLRPGKRGIAATSGPGSYRQAIEAIHPGASMDESDSAGGGIYSKDREKITANLNEAMLRLIMRGGSPAQKAAELSKSLRDLENQAKNEKDPVERSKLQAKAIGIAGDLSDINRSGRSAQSLDNLASHGLYIGGSQMANDPRLQIEIDTRDAVVKILSEFQTLKQGIPVGPMRNL